MKKKNEKPTDEELMKELLLDMYPGTVWVHIPDDKDEMPSNDNK